MKTLCERLKGSSLQPSIQTVCKTSNKQGGRSDYPHPCCHAAPDHAPCCCKRPGDGCCTSSRCCCSNACYGCSACSSCYFNSIAIVAHDFSACLSNIVLWGLVNRRQSSGFRVDHPFPFLSQPTQCRPEVLSGSPVAWCPWDRYPVFRHHVHQLGVLTSVPEDEVLHVLERLEFAGKVGGCMSHEGRHPGLFRVL